MPEYTPTVLHHFKHPSNCPPVYLPSKFIAPIYGEKFQYAKEDGTCPIIPPSVIKHVQSVVGNLLYYVLALENTMLTNLGDLTAAQTKKTQKTVEAMTEFLNYAVTCPNANIRYQKRDMILHTYSDASYLSSPKSRSK